MVESIKGFSWHYSQYITVICWLVKESDLLILFVFPFYIEFYS